ncbi:D-Ala-D-Ala carboxypeptidase family metallohydrolase, partial [Microcystis sp. LE19-59.1C]
AFNLAHDARSLGRRTLTFKDRVNRTIPIFEALVASDNNNASYNAELGYAYISSQPPDLDKAISYLDRAIELRIPGASTEGDSWKYEMNRAIARIGLGNSQSRDDILKDLFAVEQRKGLAQAIDEYERDGVDGGNNSIKNWLIQNQDWVSQQTNGKALLDKIQLSAVAKPVTSTLSVTQNRADLVAAPPNTKIKATIKTYLKKQPIDSSQLGENEKKEVPVGTEYKILKHSQESDGHCLVELDYGQGIWYIWSDHWYLPWEHKILSSVPQSSKNGSAREAIDQLSRISAISLTNRGTLKAAATRSIQRSATTTKVEPENWVIAPPNTIIKATTKTYLKKQPIDSSDLGENEKKEVPVGREYKVLKYSEEIDGHCLVELDYGAGTWYLWSDHWHLPWQQSSRNNSLSSVSAPESSQHQGVNLVTRQQAESVYGRKMSDKQFNDLNSCLQRFEINTVPRIRHFLSQTAHESGGLQYMTEIWRPSQVAAQRTYDPPYPKAKELGNTKIGEGKKYRGAGAIQLTGKYNYQAFSRFINDPKVMDGADYVGANYPFTSAGFWWKNNNMNALCDRGATCRQISARVNGRDPANHLQERQRYYDKACQVIKQLPSTPLHTEELAAKPETGKAATESSDQVSKVEVVREMPKILTPKDVDWSDMSTHLTPHFTLGENLRNDPRRIPHDTTLQNNILTIMRELEKIRTDYGKPIIITSGYRPEQINRAVGGLSNSQHIRGTAVDICPAHGDVFEFQKWVDQHWYGALGWGAKKGFVHIDCRNGKGWKTGGEKGVRWNY